MHVWSIEWYHFQWPWVTYNLDFKVTQKTRIFSRTALDQVSHVMSKIYTIRCNILRLKCTKFNFGRGSAPDPAGELTALPCPLAGSKGARPSQTSPHCGPPNLKSVPTPLILSVRECPCLPRKMWFSPTWGPVLSLGPGAHQEVNPSLVISPFLTWPWNLVWGCSRSLKTAPFDRPYTTFYWSAIVHLNMALCRFIWHWIISWVWNLS